MTVSVHLAPGRVRTGGDGHAGADDRTTPRLLRPARLLVEAVEELRAQDPTELGGRQALAETALLLREMEKLSGVSLRRLSDVDRRELYSLDGAPGVGSWVERQHVGADRTRVTLARRLSRVPVLAEAVEAGRVSVADAAKVAEAVESLRPHLDRPDGLIDGQAAEPVIEAVIVDGVTMLVGQSRGGMADQDAVALSWSWLASPARRCRR